MSLCRDVRLLFGNIRCFLARNKRSWVLDELFLILMIWFYLSCSSLQKMIIIIVIVVVLLGILALIIGLSVALK